MKYVFFRIILTLLCIGMKRSSFASSGTSFHLFPVLLMRCNFLYLILYFRKFLRSLCRWGHLHTGFFASSGTSFHLFPLLLMRYNFLYLILYFRKPLRGLCRWGHLHTQNGMQRSSLHLVKISIPSNGSIQFLHCQVIHTLLNHYISLLTISLSSSDLMKL